MWIKFAELLFYSPVNLPTFIVLTFAQLTRTATAVRLHSSSLIF